MQLFCSDPFTILYTCTTVMLPLSDLWPLNLCAQQSGPPLPPCSAPPTMPLCVLPSPQVGDQILEVNGRSFLCVPHDEAVRVLKSSRHLMMTVKDVGRLPHARTVVGETKWIASSQIAESSANSSVGGWGFCIQHSICKIGNTGPLLLWHLSLSRNKL